MAQVINVFVIYKNRLTQLGYYPCQCSFASSNNIKVTFVSGGDYVFNMVSIIDSLNSHIIMDKTVIWFWSATY